MMIHVCVVKASSMAVMPVGHAQLVLVLPHLLFPSFVLGLCLLFESSLCIYLCSLFECLFVNAL